ncbi:cytochrome P450 [Paenibacillus sp. WLX1005]|uniref:cytochrome P450 n=1 Tax=Paenibacillus sp. WLX1005 TaxID=3243766 RepID=UPI003983E129
MYKEIVTPSEISNFGSRSEQFFPIDWLKRMVTGERVYYHEATNTWNVFRYNDVKEVMGNYQYFSNRGSRTTTAVGARSKEGVMPEKLQLTSLDPPDHRKARSLLSAAFTPRSLKHWEPRIQQIINDLLDEIDDSQPFDVVDELATALPAIVMADLLGLPSEDRLLFKSWVDVLFQPYVGGQQEEIEQQKQQAAREYYEHLYPLVVYKRSHLAEDIISDLLTVEVDGERFTDDEIVRTTMLILGAGIETTSHALSNTFYSLLYDDPSLYAQLHREPTLAAPTVEEMLRYRFHTGARHRTVKQDNELLGQTIKEGELVIAWMSAANMDGDMFEDPFRLNIHRANNKKHLTFGNGPHFCLGAPLARMELSLALQGFSERFADIQPAGAFDLESNLTNSATGQSLTSLPVIGRRA